MPPLFRPVYYDKALTVVVLEDPALAAGARQVQHQEDRVMLKQCLVGAGLVALVTVAWLASSGTSEAGPFANRRWARNNYYNPGATVTYTETTYVQPSDQTYYPDEGRRRFGLLRRNRIGTTYSGTGYIGGNMGYTYVDAGTDSVTYSTSGYRPGDATTARGSAELPARLRIALPAERADVWIQGEKSEQTKAIQDYVSPPLTSGKQYYYEVKARWTDSAGKQVERSKSFPIVPGQPVYLDFTRVASTDKEKIKLPKDENPNKK